MPIQTALTLRGGSEASRGANRDAMQISRYNRRNRDLPGFQDQAGTSVLSVAPARDHISAIRGDRACNGAFGKDGEMGVCKKG